jgi:hypothetical protein
VVALGGASGAVVGRASLPERITPDQPLTRGSMIVAYDSIWTTSGEQGTVVRLRLAA